MSDFRHEFVAFCSKWWVWLCYIGIGIMGKIFNDLRRKRRMTFWQAIGGVGIAGFVGYLASIWCIKHNPYGGAYIVPIATLLADKILMYLLALNYQAIFDVVLNRKK